jgi:hypothetical protein
MGIPLLIWTSIWLAMMLELHSDQNIPSTYLRVYQLLYYRYQLSPALNALIHSSFCSHNQYYYFFLKYTLKEQLVLLEQSFLGHLISYIFQIGLCLTRCNVGYAFINFLIILSIIL